MTTNLKIIEDALKDINVLGETATASAEQGAHGIRKLNQMMASWRDADSIDLGYFPQTSTADTIPIPEWAELAVSSSLSVVLAPKYGASISDVAAAVVNSFYSSMLRRVQLTRLKPSDLSHMPRGSGASGYGWDVLTDQ